MQNTNQIQPTTLEPEKADIDKRIKSVTIKLDSLITYHKKIGEAIVELYDLLTNFEQFTGEDDDQPKS